MGCYNSYLHMNINCAVMNDLLSSILVGKEYGHPFVQRLAFQHDIINYAGMTI